MQKFSVMEDSEIAQVIYDPDEVRKGSRAFKVKGKTPKIILNARSKMGFLIRWGLVSSQTWKDRGDFNPAVTYKITDYGLQHLQEIENENRTLAT